MPTPTSDVAYRTVDSPIGAVLLAATEDGLVRVAFESEGFDRVLETLAARIGPVSVQSSVHLDRASQEIEEYFAGTRREFDVPLDHRLSTGFRRTVQEFLPRIGYGSTMTYQQVAERVGNPAAVRAVGSGCATNPLPLVVPCHRVVRSDGALGGYLGGPETKRALLEMEAAHRQDRP